jgi:hypothetical protein
MKKQWELACGRKLVGHMEEKKEWVSCLKMMKFDLRKMILSSISMDYIFY